MKKDTAAIILAAGKSTRMKSETPKVIHPVCGRPMVGYVFDLVRSLKIGKKVAVLGFKAAEVRKLLGADIKIALQKKLLGTADAVKAAMPSLAGFKGTVLILYGDIPLLKKETIRKLIDYHCDTNADATILIAELSDPASYGRILRDKYSSIRGIIEEKDADEFDKSIKEVNTGIICFKAEALRKALKEIKANNRKKEYYLTDAINIIYKNGGLIEAVKLTDINEALGINTRVDLAKANSIMQKRLNQEFMKNGVSIVDPDTAFINYGVKIGVDTTIYPFTVIESNVKIGKRCSLGPFIHLREGTSVEDNAVVGNFIETVRTHIGSDVFAKHFCYLGDARLSRRVNIGAGTVCANFDGKIKSKTIIGDNAFIGSDTVLIAPVRVGKSAKTGAGSVVTRNVRPGDCVVGIPARPIKKKRG